MSKQNSVELLDAWNRYKNSGDLSARDFIIISYAPLVSRIAREIYRKKPAGLDEEDLVQSGMIGLINAIERFDLERGNLFSTFATLRIRGEIYDSINKLDWTPRLVRERIKAVLRAVELHYKENSHIPTPEELSEIILTSEGKEITPVQVQQAHIQARKTYVHAVENSTVLMHEEDEVDFVGMGGVRGTEHQAERNELKSTIERIISNECSDLEIAIIRESVLNEMTNKQVAAKLGLSSSKVSSIRRAAISRIKDALIENGVSPLIGL